MKKIVFAAIIAATTMLVSCIPSSMIVGNGVEAKGAFDMTPDYTSLSVSSGISVELVDTPTSEGLITADEEVLPYVSIVREGGSVKVSYEPLIAVRTDIKTVVTMPVSAALDDIDVSSAGQLKSEGRLLCSSMEIECSSAGLVDLDMDAQSLGIDLTSAASFSGNVVAKEIEVEMLSAAQCYLGGSADHLDVETYSAANFRGFGLVSRRVDADAASGGSVEVSVTDELEAEASSGGAVRYKGSPEIIRRRQSSGGSVREVN